MIELLNLTKVYPNSATNTPAIKDINLHIKAGEVFGVIGPSGAGKSTLIRCVNLLERPTAGQILVDGENVMQLSKLQLRLARRKIAMIFQHFNLLASRTAYENIALPLELIGKKKKEIENLITPLLELTGLSDKKNAYPNELSGGQKQRVAIARALANNPKVLLCDEATSALDPQTTHSILALLKDINKKFGITILLITHEMNVVKEICHRLAILQHGHIVEQAEVIKFFSQPESAIAKDFVRSELKQHLPENLQNRILPQRSVDAIPLLQISFIGRAAEEPFIAHLIKKYAINLNILQAHVESIRDEIVGTMIVEADGDLSTIDRAISYLENKNINVEIIGYVKRNI